MNEAKRISHLQEIDQEVDAKQKALASVLLRLGDDSILREAVTAREQARHWLKELEKVQRFAEAEVDAIATKLHEVENKLYSGKVTNLKELGGLQEEFEQLKSKLRQEEDRVLGVMGEVEAAQKSLKVQEKAFKEVDARWREQQEALSQERSALEAAIAQLKERRGRLAVEIDPSSLAVYEGLRVAKQGKAVARVEQGRCQGCRLSLSVAELNLARGSRLVQCSSCHRILFLD